MSELVYHYTSLQTLLAIIESKTWRFTNIGFLNDGNEYHFAWDLAKDMGIVDSARETRSSIQPYFVSCFSEEGDSFSQWSMYGDGGQGVAIGVDLDLFPSCIDNVDYSSMQIVKVIYNRSEQELLLQPLLGMKRNSQWHELILEVRLAELAFRVKQSAFSSEQETRAVVRFEWLDEPQDGHNFDTHGWLKSADSILQYSSSGGTIRPFLSMRLVDLSIIKSVIVGPKTSPYLPNVLKQLFWRNVIGAAIEHSKIRT